MHIGRPGLLLLMQLFWLEGISLDEVRKRRKQNSKDSNKSFLGESVNPATRDTEAGGLLEVKSSGLAWATYHKPVSHNKEYKCTQSFDNLLQISFVVPGFSLLIFISLLCSSALESVPITVSLFFFKEASPYLHS